MNHPKADAAAHVLTSISPIETHGHLVRFAGEIQMSVVGITDPHTTEPTVHVVFFPSAEFELDMAQLRVGVRVTCEQFSDTGVAETLNLFCDEHPVLDRGVAHAYKLQNCRPPPAPSAATYARQVRVLISLYTAWIPKALTHGPCVSFLLR